MAWELDICGDEAISMPENEKCDECAEFAERLADTEAELADLQDLLKNYTEYEAGTHVVFTEIEPGLVRINAHVEGGGGGGKDYIAGPGIQIDDLDEISADVREHEIARTEKSIAEDPHGVGEYFILNNRLYKVTAAIAVDDTIAEGTNVVETNVGDELAEKTRVTREYPTKTGNYIARLDGYRIGELKLIHFNFSLNTAFDNLPQKQWTEVGRVPEDMQPIMYDPVFSEHDYLQLRVSSDGKVQAYKYGTDRVSMDEILVYV